MRGMNELGEHNFSEGRVKMSERTTRKTTKKMTKSAIHTYVKYTWVIRKER